MTRPPKIAIATRTPADWIDEFRRACEELSLPYSLVDICRDDWTERVREVDILLWRIHLRDQIGLAEAMIKIPLVEQMGVLCFPNSLMASLYDNKIGQTFFLRRHGHPTPGTFSSFSESDAMEYAAAATYPLVAKTSGGASSDGVRLLRDRQSAEKHIRRAFKEPTLRVLSRRVYGRVMGKRRSVPAWRPSVMMRAEGYVVFQEYIASEGDLRVATLGRSLVSVFRRRNRPNDFRASGSGLWERLKPDDVPVDPCRLALQVSEQQGFTSMTYDFLRAPSGWVILEMSYTFLLSKVYTDNLFELCARGLEKRKPVPIGILHLQALIQALEQRCDFHTAAERAAITVGAKASERADSQG